MSTAVALYDDFTEDERRLIHETYAKGTSPAEFNLFMAVCHATGLNPLKRQIYAIMRGSGDRKRMVIQTGIDGYRKMAGDTHELAGRDLPEFGPMIAAASKKDVAHPEWAVVTVWRMVKGVRCPFSAQAFWEEYAPYYNGELGEMWAKMPRGQLAKCAEALAIRAGFSDATEGVYTAEEMAQADDAPALPAGRIVEAEPIAALSAPVEREPEPGAPRFVVTPTQPDKPTTRERSVEPPNERAHTKPGVSFPEFLKLVDELGFSQAEAMKELGVRSLSGLNLDEALEKLETLAGAGSIASQLGMEVVSVEPAPADEPEKPAAPNYPEDIRADGTSDIAIATFLGEAAKLGYSGSGALKRIQEALGVPDLMGVSYTKALKKLSGIKPNEPEPKKRTAGATKAEARPAQTEPGTGSNTRAALRRLASEAGVADADYLPLYRSLFGDDFSHDAEVAFTAHLQARKDELARTHDLRALSGAPLN